MLPAAGSEAKVAQLVIMDQQRIVNDGNEMGEAEQEQGKGGMGWRWVCVSANIIPLPGPDPMNQFHMDICQ